MKNSFLTFLIIVIFWGCSSKEPYLKNWNEIEQKELNNKSLDGEYLCTPETSPSWYKNNWPYFFIGDLNKKIRNDYYHSKIIGHECYSFIIEGNKDGFSMIFFNKEKDIQSKIDLKHKRDYVFDDNQIKMNTHFSSTNYIAGLATSTNILLKNKSNDLIIKSESSATLVFWPIPGFWTYWAKFHRIDIK
ncbi:MAG: hypothetical protein ACNI3C_11100 [Candidatus Marinarcus sp.]|uniref:hypothetical protein n=1 Tax=Candidatus Marinarcus sp. TaxID=3100987 RepID=UPI003AFFC0F2